MVESKPKWLKIRECAELKGVHPNTIRNAIKAGKLPAHRLGRNIIRISQADLDTLFTPYQGGEYGIWAN